ncbi:MAG: NTPase [Algoriphagus sp.]|nr:NTPase [Algoriphagus sp.]
MVLVSSDPSASPSLPWQALADSLHSYLIAAGGDPVGYLELEQVVLSKVRQAEYAKAFQQRQIQQVVLITRQKEKVSIHVAPLSGDANFISTIGIASFSGKDWKEAGQAANTNQKVFQRKPLNLEVFKLGIPLEGSAALIGPMSYYRYDLLGKNQEVFLAELENQKKEIEEIFKQNYPHAFVWLTESRSTQELINDQVQFVLVKASGPQGDLMRSFGLDPVTGEEANLMVVKYYINLLVRDEIYLGPSWDAAPNSSVALRQFLENLKK